MGLKYLIIGLSTLMSLQSYKVHAHGTPKSSSSASLLKPFSTDGCSAAPDSLLGNDFTHCCIAHDVDYYVGGTSKRKTIADRRLKACMEETIGNININQTRFQKNLEWSLGEFYRTFVILGGAPNFKVADNPFPWKWGYGWVVGPISYQVLIPGEFLLGINELQKARAEIQEILNSPSTEKTDHGVYQGLELSGAQLFYILNIVDWKIKELKGNLTRAQ